MAIALKLKKTKILNFYCCINSVLCIAFLKLINTSLPCKTVPIAIILIRKFL